MKVKHLALLVAVLGGASVATFLLKRGDDAPTLDEREGKSLIDPALLDQTTAVHLDAPAGDVDVTKSESAGGKWIVTGYHDLPADFSKIKTLIDDLRKAKIVRFASARAERIATMGFDGTALELRGPDAKPLVTVHLGKNVESGGRFVKLNDETKAYVASFGAYLDTTAKNWADTALVTAKAEEIVGIEASFPDGSSLHLKRENGTAPWTAEGLAAGEKLKESEVSSLVSKFTGLRFNETSDPTAEEVTAARANARTFKITLTTGKSYEIALGRKPAPPAPPAPPQPETPPAEGAEATTPPAPPPPPPAGPVYAFVTSSDPNDAINTLMQRRGFQIYEWTFTSLPANRAALVEAAPPAPAPASEAAPTPAPETEPSTTPPAAPAN